MSSEPYIVEIAVLLLLALVLGGLAGFWARRWFTPRSVANAEAKLQPQAIDASTSEEKNTLLADTTLPVASATTDNGKPVLLEKARNGAADDLKKIKGIGPKIEKTLNELGVFHFDQIAAWDAAAIVWVDEKLSFRGRIARENWIAQAQAFTVDNSNT